MKMSSWILFAFITGLQLLCLVHSRENDVHVTVYNFLDIQSKISVALFDMDNPDVVTIFKDISYSDCSSNITSTGKTGVSKCWNVTFTLEQNQTKYYLPEVCINNRKLVLLTIYGNVNSPKVRVTSSTTSTVRKLKIDKALLSVTNQLPYPLMCTELSHNCYKCSEYPIATIFPGDTSDIIVDTKFAMSYFFRFNGSNHTECRLSRHFQESSQFTYLINKTVHGKCHLHETRKGRNSYLPILYAAIVLIGSFVIWTAGIYAYSWMHGRGMLHWRKVDRVYSKDMGDPEVQSVRKDYGTVNTSESTNLLISTTELTPNGEERKKKRLKSLDTIRGLSLIIMIFVNYGGGGYWFFDHSRWNGVTVADLVFPWFVWIMGVSIVFSFRGRRKDSFLSRLYQIVRRTVILMVLGLFLNNGFKLSSWRIPGVLQRFAVSYFVVTLTELLTVPVYARWRFKFSIFQDLTHNWIQWIIVFVLELVWLSITFFLPVPGCPRGYLGPGGISDNGKHYNCTGGAAGHVDKWLLTDAHIYQHPTCKELYHCGPYEPEGVLGSLNSIVICFLGVQAGRIIVYHQQHGSRIIRFVIWGLVLGGVAAVLCEGKKNEGFIPLNKNLWSLSFILAMSGSGYILLAVFYFLIDVMQIWNGSPFIYPGMNSILVYVGSELLEGMFPFGWNGMKDSHMQYLISNIISVMIWSLIAYYWYSIDFFVKI